MSDTEMSHAYDLYFTKPLPWHEMLWQRLTRLSQVNQLPHAMLFSGMQGLGKRQLVWQLIARTLCESDSQKTQVACGQCQSCLWLKAGTHPNLQVLPDSSKMGLNQTQDNPNNTTKSKQKKSEKAKTKKDSKEKDEADNRAQSIKIDDIRALIPFLHQQSTAHRFCVLDYAEGMTIAAANALLKSLEEPPEGMHFILISDSPARLLPTILSRVQRFDIAPSFADSTVQYIANSLNVNFSEGFLAEYNMNVPTQQDVEQVLRLAQGAPFRAMKLFTMSWFYQRETWLITWRALRNQLRTVTAATEYWQGQIPITAFIELTALMLDDLSRISVGLQPLQTDIDWQSFSELTQIPFEQLHYIRHTINDIEQASKQNVQDNLSYAKLLQVLADT